MEFWGPLPGATGHHVDLADPLVIQQEHGLLLLERDKNMKIAQKKKKKKRKI